MTSTTHLFKNTMRVYVAELICSTFDNIEVIPMFHACHQAALRSQLTAVGTVNKSVTAQTV